MKLTAVILLSACLQLSARGLSQSVTMSAKQVSLEKVFSTIKKQTGYTFWYNVDLLNEARKIDLSVKNASLQQTLDICFSGQPLAYEIVGRIVVIRQRNMVTPVKTEIPPAAPDVKGTVTDSAGNPMQGVAVSLTGEKKGMVTDRNGNFSLPAATGARLRFSYIGYIAQEITITDNTVLTIRLQAAPSALNEVVVVGYGTQQRKDVTGAVSSISSRNFENQQFTGLDQAIAGQAAGVQVMQKSGTPGGGVTVRVRGTGSISAGNEPLYVIDGFPIEGGYNRDLNPLATLNPNDIESIQILKDASAAAIYGSRGSNGVVIVTTKRGKSGKTKIQLDSYFGSQKVANKIDMLNASEYASFNTEARNNAWVDAGGKASDPNSVRPDRLKIPPMFENPASLGAGTDWQDAVFRRAAMQNYQLTVSGGNENTQYLISGNYFKQDGIVIHTKFERYSSRINLDHRVGSKMKIGFNLAPSYTKNDVLPVEDQVFTGGILGSALAMPPTVPVYNPNGSFSSLLNTSPFNIGVIENPVAIASKIKGGSVAFRTLGSVFGEYMLLPSLKLKSSFGVDYYDARTSFFSPSTLGRAGVPAPVIPIGNANSFRDFTWLNENTLTYDKLFRKDHAINLLAGYTSQKSYNENIFVSAINFPNDLVTTLNAGQVSSGGTTRAEWSLVSLIGRLNYSYQSRYLLSATIRRDGSSRFGSANRWGTFPSASIGWNLSRESFMKDVAFVSNLKLRASYGLAGNNAIGNYSSIGLLSANRYVFGTGNGTVVNGLQPFSITNEQLGWEIMKQFNVGLDLSVLKNRLSFIVDYYEKTTSDLLLSVPVPASTGYTNALQNIGKVSNKGWEFTMNTRPVEGAVTWNFSVNVAFDRNKVLALGPKGDPIIVTSPSFSPQTHITMIGQPLASFYGYKTAGVYLDQADVDKGPKVPGAAGSRPGDLKFVDVNGDGSITPLDLTIIGKNQPDYTFGVTSNVSYKNFDLSILIDGAQGFEVLNGARRNIGLVSGSYSRRDVLGRWQSPAVPGDGKTPRANTAPTGGNVFFVSSLLIEDASFLRVRNINLRYQVPAKLFRRLPVVAANVYASVQNAFTFTKYRGYNPEQNLNGASSLTPGVDFNGYPIARVFTLGVNITFQ